MSAVSYDVTYTEDRNRLTTAFRMILVIPHMIVLGLWQYLAQFVALIQWFFIVFTGKRNQGIFNLEDQWLGYATRVMSYYSLMSDPYPPFGTEPGATGVTYAMPYEEDGDRMTNGLRFIWAIPCIVIMFGLVIAATFVAIASWFAIVITGKHPRGMFDFLRKAHRYSIQTTSYILLMTDTYPSYGSDSTVHPAPYPTGYPAAPPPLAPPAATPYPTAPPPAAPATPPPPPAAPWSAPPPG